MNYLFISAHLDDVVISCGDYIYELIQHNNNVLIATVFTGEDAELSMLARILHRKFGLGLNAMEIRRQEDKNAIELLGASYLHLNLLECIYRKKRDNAHVYKKLTDIFNVNLNTERAVIDDLITVFLNNINLNSYQKIYIPLGIGRHVDHCIVRTAVEQYLQIAGSNSMDKLFYYEDMPYVCYNNNLNWKLEQADVATGLHEVFFHLPYQNLKIKIQAIEQYRSQLKMLWISKYSMLKQMSKHVRMAKLEHLNYSKECYSFKAYTSILNEIDPL